MTNEDWVINKFEQVRDSLKSNKKYSNLGEDDAVFVTLELTKIAAITEGFMGVKLELDSIRKEVKAIRVYLQAVVEDKETQ